MQRERVNEIFELALGVPVSERLDVVDAACGDDVALREAVVGMLDALDRAHGFLANPTAAAMPPSSTSVAGRGMPLVGAVIDGFKLLECIGEGGFGSVFMAEQTEPIRRRVAVKILKPGMDSRSVIGRFEAERQALAMMDHPNIAKVLDAGTTAFELGSRPYFVMELVRGVPVTRYCDEAKLSPRERLELMLPICRAVQHAHSKGIIHRDIKPSNVLVTLHDGVAVPKVIDFGIAKATTQPLTDKTVFTEFRALIGTPAYMSPEQAEMSGLDIDTRSDVYSLGVLVYELLTGSTPFETTELLRAGIAEMQRIIREREPAKPSTRLSTAGEALRSIADSRRVPPEKLGRVVRGELDWIVMKSLEKDRNRRYGTAEALGQDISRYLAGEAVVAAPPSRAYVVRKFVRRHRPLVAASLVIVAALLIGAAGLALGLVRATEERLIAQASAESARRSLVAARLNAAQGALRAVDGAEARRQLDFITPAERAWEWEYVDCLLVPPATTWTLMSDAVQTRTLLSPSGTRGIMAEVETGRGALFDATEPDRSRPIHIPNESFFAVPLDQSDVALCQMLRPVESLAGFDFQHGRELWRRPGRLVGMVDGQRGLKRLQTGDYAIFSVHDGSRLATVSGSPLLSADGLVVRAMLVRDRGVIDIDSGARLGPPPPIQLSKWIGGRIDTERGLYVILMTQGTGFSSSVVVWRADGSLVWSREVGGGGESVSWSADRERVWLNQLTSVVAFPLHKPSEAATIALTSPMGMIREPPPGSPFALVSDDRGRLMEVALRGAPGPWLFEGPFHVSASATDISPDTSLVATGDWGAVTLFDARTGAVRWRRGGWSRFIRAVAIAPDGSTVVAGAERGRLRCYDAATGRTLWQSEPVAGEDVTALLVLPGGRVLSGSSSGAVRLFNAQSPNPPLAALPGRGAAIDGLIPTPDGSGVLCVVPGTGRHDGQVDRKPAPEAARPDFGLSVRAVDDLRLLVHRPMPDEPPSAAAFSPDGARLAYGTVAGRVVLADAATLRDVGEIARVPEQVRALCWSADGSRLFSGDASGVRVIDPVHGGIIAKIDERASIRLRFAPSDRSLLSTAYAGTTRFEVRLPSSELLLERERVFHAMAWLRTERPWAETVDQIRPRFASDVQRDPQLRREALALLKALGDQPAQLNNSGLLAIIEGDHAPRLAQAIEALDVAIRDVPDAPNFRLTRASLLSKLGRHAEAQVAFAEARRLYAEYSDLDPPLLDALEAELLHEAGDVEGASAAMARARAVIEATSDPERRAILERQLADTEQSLSKLGKSKAGGKADEDQR
ncbi:MAG: protein kinase [Planctomycetota bacterium]|nr:protein kinase [Planctomycetota bacterium]